MRPCDQRAGTEDGRGSSRPSRHAPGPPAPGPRSCARSPAAPRSPPRQASSTAWARAAEMWSAKWATTWVAETDAVAAGEPALHGAHGADRLQRGLLARADGPGVLGAAGHDRPGGAVTERGHPLAGQQVGVGRAQQQLRGGLHALVRRAALVPGAGMAGRGRRRRGAGVRRVGAVRGRVLTRCGGGRRAVVAAAAADGEGERDQGQEEDPRHTRHRREWQRSDGGTTCMRLVTDQSIGWAGPGQVPRRTHTAREGCW